ncbi:alpha-1,6-mannosylglycoprotein 6-beta-N-acetylglucosaminyltransferase B isoform X1 [Amblyraja radiata]|uniref:alpha-1,6-mannosylglycoprotein 6-beta-N-acetylglucosaminyltransferase B isoform X1 n=2 Tax=Amblyraja radiata TaxID=386614 RepID=UPI001403EF70|nr:alpha-1,6-mannosylglycoprotein 6-beta-N-acetylglucosaminyltransferase B isoform X1 [Amblyraja radiata]XP_032900510.1 alpha-1,6-mannosylglycoprotein 6-beta-N-acetylglucosaminyltransferase B isoform X1 [Amblyraja radiata]
MYLFSKNSTNSDSKIMVRRFLVTLRPFRLFVAGIGFFTLCFIMTSLGGQFSGKRLGESPFGIRQFGIKPEGIGLEFRVLRKLTDMLEIILKRMEPLAKLENVSDFRKLEELSSALNHFQHAGLLEKIEAIAQNVSNLTIKMEQFMQASLMAGREGSFSGKAKGKDSSQCEIPKDPRFPDCLGKIEWMRARWTSDPCYAHYGVDGTDCSFLEYLSEREWFCPPLPWKNRTAAPTRTKTKEQQKAFYRKDFAQLLELMGSGKESLIFMKKRIRRLSTQWILAAQNIDQKLEMRKRQRKKMLVHLGFLTEEAGDVFSPIVSKGGPLGELVQWADILATLYVLGHSLKISATLRELQSFLGVPPGRGSCPLTEPLTFDLIYTDYHGLQQMKQHMGLSFKKYKCRIRVIDTFGTEPAYNFDDYATLRGYRTNWGHWNLNPKQYMTMFPHSPDNSFMGFVAEILNDTEKEAIQSSKINNMAVVYGKDPNMWKGKAKYLEVINRYMEIHGTVYYETHWPPEMPVFVKNHGLLPQHELQRLLRKAKLFIGLGFPYEGPAPLEAIANGCIFLQPRFNPPHNSKNNEFFRGKPTSREVSSQHPYTEYFIGKPHVWTVDYNNTEELAAVVRTISETKVEPYLPYEFTCEGMLERVHAYIQHQDLCETVFLTWPQNYSRHISSPANNTSLLVVPQNVTGLPWSPNVNKLLRWPPVSSMHLHVSTTAQSCTNACQEHGLICEPTFFQFINNKLVFERFQFVCDSIESEANHLYPAFEEIAQDCYLQKQVLLFSCAGHHPKYRRFCPCRDFRKEQVALCKGCL